MNISLVVAMDKRSRLIGVDNQIPWNLPSDLKHFKRLTTGGTVVMGRKTYESIGKPLKNRRNVVLTSDKSMKADGVEFTNSVHETIGLVGGDENVFIIGGSKVYQDFLPFCKFLYISYVESGIEGAPNNDAYFPRFNEASYPILRRWPISREEDDFSYSLVVHRNVSFDIDFRDYFNYSEFERKLGI